jgi:hypothetical protein
MSDDWVNLGTDGGGLRFSADAAPSCPKRTDRFALLWNIKAPQPEDLRATVTAPDGTERTYGMDEPWDLEAEVAYAVAFHGWTSRIWMADPATTMKITRDDEHGYWALVACRRAS